MSVLKGEGSYPILFDTRSIPVRTLTHTAYVARPDLAGEWSTVLLIGGAKGLSSPLRDLCRRLARHGFAAVAPDLYAKGQVPEDRAAAVAAFDELDPAAVRRVLRDVGRYLDDASGPWDTDDNGFGVIAVQEGALLGLETAVEFGSPLVLMAPRLREPSPGLADDFTELPAAPGVMERLGELLEPVLGLIGREDEVSPLDDVMTTRSGAPHSQWVIYDGAGHDFLDDNEPGFDQAAFADALERTVDFLEKNL